MKFWLLFMAVLPHVAFGECYMRSITVNEMSSQIERTADVVKELVPIQDQKQCTVTFRVMISGNWYTALGRSRDSVTTDDAQLCARAMDLGRARVLQDIAGSSVAMTQELICTDQDLPKNRQVKIGDVVRESEVAPHWDPAKRQSFPYKGMECRWFMENVSLGAGGIAHNLGVMCRVKNEQWHVLEKWRLGG
jgi:hypothetical protein